MVKPWATAWLRRTDTVDFICMELAGDNPAEYRRIKSSCSYSDVAMAWMNAQRKTEDTGYTISKR